MGKRICVIGAGASGLPAIKTCLEEGFEVVCYEKTSSLGGLWRYRDDDKEGVASVMKSTIINSSKEMSAYSDFPPPSHFSNFMHNSRVLEYFELYANKFNLHPYIKYMHTVLQVRFAKGYEFTGKWVVKVQNEDGHVEDVTFDGVMVCIGHHTYPYSPKFQGLDSFKGKVLHTHSYKTPNGFEDKNIVVIGIGNSGGDVSVELSRFAKKVYLSTRTGTWVHNRVDDRGRPLDMTITRFLGLFWFYFPWALINAVFEKKLNWRFDHEEFGLKPKHRALAQHIMVNDDLPNRLQSGTVILKNDVDHFTETGVVFKSDPTEYPVDVVILATGYEIRFPMIPEDIIEVKENKVSSLYKFVFPYELQKHTLAVIGLIQPYGAIMPISEMQSRWAAKVFKGECSLPSRSAMKADIKEKWRAMEKYYSKSPRHTIQVNYLSYMDEISTFIGAKPKLLSLAWKDPQLMFHLFFGPAVPYQYRLNGPHPWPGAVDAILTTEKRILAPLRTRELDRKQYNNNIAMAIFVSIFSFFGLLVITFMKLS